MTIHNINLNNAFKVMLVVNASFMLNTLLKQSQYVNSLGTREGVCSKTKFSDPCENYIFLKVKRSSPLYTQKGFRFIN